MSTGSNYRTVEVLEPQNHPHYQFTLYKVFYRNVDSEENVQITIYKRYSEFKRLYDQMSTIHLNLHRTSQFPNFVKANFFDRFDKDVIELRRKSSEELLKFICENKHLHNHKCFKDFLNSGIKKTIPTNQDLFDSTFDNVSIEKSLPSPLKPISLHQRLSLDDSTSKDFKEFPTVDGFLSKSTSSLESPSDEDGLYIEHASELLKGASMMEIDKQWDLALKNYENAIEILLKGAKLDKNKARVSIIHKQVKSHLDKAESISKTYIQNNQDSDEDALLKLLDQCIVLKSNNTNEVM